MIILNEKEVLDFLQIPSVPKREWDGKTSFKNGVAVVNLYGGLQMYAVATFDSEIDVNPRIKKVFSEEPFYDIDKVYVVPAYMATQEDVDNFDVDEQSKAAASAILAEAKEIEHANQLNETEEEQVSEWVFDEIHSMDEAVAWLKSYNSKNHIKSSRIPKTEETMKLRLLAIKETIKQK